ncbi:uncharacterized protein LOC126722921 [Quercus robur]|uniref:uncharacterized protein LOC126722921 n=1 Tax=Quercus robur TaxID=38942 RepID=UPI0021620A41|nr:uncharacterized protein LOC126722921 [Quercus robur]
MLGVLCARPKPWILTSLSYHSFFHGSAAHHHQNPRRFHNGGVSFNRRRHHSTACRLEGPFVGGGAASIWHAITPSSTRSSRRSGGGGGDISLRLRRKSMLRCERRGEGSWNVAWDARPARWLHRPDSAWLLFGVCACLNAPPLLDSVAAEENAEAEERIDGCDNNKKEMIDGSALVESNTNNTVNNDYRVTGVLADGRCLFRAIAHGACLRSGVEAPDDNRQRELADELRAQVVDELSRRREETEWFIEGDFDAYVTRIQQPYVWGGEPELLMASHVLKTPISVFMINRTSGALVNIAKYGEEYRKDEESPINVLFHGYGHYDLLEYISEESCQK